jgi:hypothetical protein
VIPCTDLLAKPKPPRPSGPFTPTSPASEASVLISTSPGEPQARGRQFRERVGYLAVDRILSQAADDHGNVANLVDLVPHP